MSGLQTKLTNYTSRSHYTAGVVFKVLGVCSVNSDEDMSVSLRKLAESTEKTCVWLIKSVRLYVRGCCKRPGRSIAVMLQDLMIRASCA